MVYGVFRVMSGQSRTQTPPHLNTKSQLSSGFWNAHFLPSQQVNPLSHCLPPRLDVVLPGIQELLHAGKWAGRPEHKIQDCLEFFEGGQAARKWSERSTCRGIRSHEIDVVGGWTVSHRTTPLCAARRAIRVGKMLFFFISGAILVWCSGMCRSML